MKNRFAKKHVIRDENKLNLTQNNTSEYTQLYKTKN